MGSDFVAWALGAVVLGVGTTAVYPTLIAQVSDLVAPRDRARAVGAYRLWRDLGYVAGGLLAGILADLLGYRITIGFVAILTAVSGPIGGRLLPSPPSPTSGQTTPAPAGREPLSHAGSGPEIGPGPRG